MKRTPQPFQNRSHFTLWSLVLLIGYTFYHSGISEDLSVSILSDNGRVVARIEAEIDQTIGGIIPAIKLQRSFDLENWDDVFLTETQTADENEFHLLFDDSTTDTQNFAFYRIILNKDIPIKLTGLVEGGENVFGIAQTFDDNYQKLKFLTIEEFNKKYAPQYPPHQQPAKDVKNAEFYDYINLNPVLYNQERPESDSDPRLYDFRLTDKEKQILEKKGLLITPRNFPLVEDPDNFDFKASSATFTEIYHRIWVDDLPVIITTDSMLHAWHQSYQNVMSDLESYYFNHILFSVLNGMHEQLKVKFPKLQGGPLETSALDVDYYLAVARSLLSKPHNLPNLGPVFPHFADEKHLNETLEFIDTARVMHFNLFGRAETTGDTLVDFSQFIVRGHYTQSNILGNYFRSAMWTGSVDFRITPSSPNPTPSQKAQSLRELGAAMIMTELLYESGQFEKWKEFDDLITHFVGVSDSMNFPELHGILKLAQAPTSEEISNIDQLIEVQNKINNGELGIQEIIAHPYVFPSNGKRSLPRSFTVFGQKFVVDSWAMGKSVFPNVYSQDQENPRTLPRRIPSGLDIAFGVLGNNHAAPILVDRILNENGMDFRDGYPIHPNLAAIRETVDGFNSDTWTANIYNGWLGKIRSLSNLPRSGNIPAVFHSSNWARKVLNTQLGSWTELRHDTVLYAKQSATPPVLCSYPFQYVEPYPEFWARMSQLASLTADFISEASLDGPAFVPEPVDPTSLGIIFQRNELKENQTKHFRHFAETAARLSSISEKQIRGIQLSQDDNDFLKSVVEIVDLHYAGQLKLSGWYPELFYRNIEKVIYEDADHPSLERDLLITDVHTDFPDTQVGDPGGIVHEAVGTPQYMFINIDHGDCHRIYIGPVYSYFETFEDLNVRKTDEEWEKEFLEGNIPPQPVWMDPIAVGFEQ